MRTLSTGSLLAIYVLMLMGGTTTVMLFPLVYRRWTFSKFRKGIEALIADTFAHQIALQIESSTHREWEDAHGSGEVGREVGGEVGPSSRPPFNHQATFLEGGEKGEEFEADAQNEQLDFEWIESQDRPNLEALVATYKRRDR
jgi:hypothetical protein